MTLNKIDVIIPFRDRGNDPCRKANLDYVVRYWKSTGLDVHVVDDGRQGDESFNRSAAYNKGVALSTANVFIFAESDLIVNANQLRKGVYLAAEESGLVVPFSKFLAIDEDDSNLVRQGKKSLETTSYRQVRSDRTSIGAVNIVSRQTMNAIGRWDETFEGAWYDDDAMAYAFSLCCGRDVRFVDGPGWHLYHLSGARGDHLSERDKQATERNRLRYHTYLKASKPKDIRALTSETLVS